VADVTRVLDALADTEPWEVPDEWLAGVRAKLRVWANDPSTLRAATFPDFVPGTPAAVWYTHHVAPLLTGWIPVLRGPYADISAALTRDFHRPTVRIGSGHVIRVASFDWPLQMISGARNFPEPARRQALELSRDVVGLFVDAPPFEARAQALVAAFDRVLAGSEVTRLHVTGDYDQIAGFWRGDFLHADERAVLPELAGPAAAFGYSLAALHRAHAGLSEVGGGDGDYSQLLARLILATGFTEVPAQVGRTLGPAAGDVVAAFAGAKDGFDPRAWLADNTEWLAQAVHQGEVTAARAWAAAATQVSVQLAGVLQNAPWPEPQIPDLAAFFDALDAERKPATAATVTPDPEPAESVDAVEIAEPAAAEDDDKLPEPLTFDDDPLGEMESLIGLESVKEAVRRMVAETKADLRRKELGLPVHERARHMVFVGKPGTAKTTVARLLSRIYKELGILEKGHVVEVDRSDLVGAGVGSTAPMTAAKFREAIGGVLFVDEAYTLTPDNSPGDFGTEAVATILKMMEDHRDDCIVIVAGYHREIQRFLESNTGLASRFPKMLSFSDYDDEQLIEIYELMARQRGMILAKGVRDAVLAAIPRPPRGHTFGNGRFMRNLLEESTSNQATRLSERDPDSLTERDLRELLPVDVKPPSSMRAEDYLLQKPGT
jgi:hypothetical protein